MGAGGAGFRPSRVRWSVFRRRRGTSAGHTLGRRSLFRRRCRVPAIPRPVVGVSPAVQGSGHPTSGGRCFAGGGGFRASHVRWSVFRRRRGTSPSPTLGRRRCRRRRGTSAGVTGGGVAAGRLGMGAGGAGFRPSHVRWSVFRRRRGTSPSPTLSRRRCRRQRGISAGGTGGGVAAGGTSGRWLLYGRAVQLLHVAE